MFGFCWIQRNFFGGFRGPLDSDSAWDNYFKRFDSNNDDSNNDDSNNNGNNFLQLESKSQTKQPPWAFGKHVNCKCRGKKMFS